MLVYLSCGHKDLEVNLPEPPIIGDVIILDEDAIFEFNNKLVTKLKVDGRILYSGFRKHPDMKYRVTPI